MEKKDRIGTWIREKGVMLREKLFRRRTMENWSLFTTILCGVLAFLLISGVMKLGKAIQTLSDNAEGTKKRYTVVIDPGHGGIDPGKVGINDVYEKEINLAIAGMLQKLLEQNDCEVIMTRTSDEGLYQEGDSNRKMADLQRRCALIEASGADVVVSIHQNSFSDAGSQGAQVFYQSASEEGKALALVLQKQLVSSLNTENHRTAKANNDYYMLKNTSSVMVIVECGFLSNPHEAELLCSPEYQKKTAWAIAMGTLQYLQGVRISEGEG